MFWERPNWPKEVDSSMQRLRHNVKTLHRSDFGGGQIMISESLKEVMDLLPTPGSAYGYSSAAHETRTPPAGAFPSHHVRYRYPQSAAPPDL